MPAKKRKSNPQPDWDWEVPATIEKADIAPTHALIGRVNAFAMEVAGECRREGTVLFRGFAGARGDDRKYHGVYRFTAAEPNAGHDTFASLPGMESVNVPSSEPTATPVEDLDLGVATDAEE